MKRTILFSSILLLSAAWAAAQNTIAGPDGASTATSSTATIEGCLDGAAGSYTLTDYAGASYPLTGNTDALKAHVGETIRVTGAVANVVHVPGAMSEGIETQPTVSVAKFQPVSAVCGDNNNLP